MNGKWSKELERLVGMKNVLVVAEVNLKNVTVQQIGDSLWKQTMKIG
tara:strand:+ start:273 stop:413 length:141 start_codon:yes stop_codon:yes gene_type:complete